LLDLARILRSYEFAGLDLGGGEVYRGELRQQCCGNE